MYQSVSMNCEYDQSELEVEVEYYYNIRCYLSSGEVDSEVYSN